MSLSKMVSTDDTINALQAKEQRTPVDIKKIYSLSTLPVVEDEKMILKSTHSNASVQIATMTTNTGGMVITKTALRAESLLASMDRFSNEYADKAVQSISLTKSKSQFVLTVITSTQTVIVEFSQIYNFEHTLEGIGNLLED